MRPDVGIPARRTGNVLVEVHDVDRRGGSRGAHDHPVDPARIAAARARLISSDEAQRVTSLLSQLADPVQARIRDAR